MKKIELLRDPDTYEKIQEHNVNTETQKFIKMLVTSEDKSGYHPTISKLFSLPKTHKPGTPMYPIAGINSIPNKLAKILPWLLKQSSQYTLKITAI